MIDYDAVASAIETQKSSLEIRRLVGCNDVLFKGHYYGRVYAKGRPRSGKYAVYTPANTVKFEKEVRDWFAVHNFKPPLSMPISVEIVVYDRRPANMPNVDDMLAEYSLKLSSIGDLADNLIKAILDALNTWLYADDSQIANCIVSRKYRASPGFDIEVRRYGMSDAELHNLKNRLANINHKWWAA